MDFLWMCHTTIQSCVLSVWYRDIGLVVETLHDKACQMQTDVCWGMIDLLVYGFNCNCNNQRLSQEEYGLCITSLV